MNRQRLREIARAEGIPDEVYLLQGDEGDWADGFDGFARYRSRTDAKLALKIVPGGWAICVYERGGVFDELRFDTEDEACDELLLKVLSIHSGKHPDR